MEDKLNPPAQPAAGENGSSQPAAGGNGSQPAAGGNGGPAGAGPAAARPAAAAAAPAAVAAACAKLEAHEPSPGRVAPRLKRKPSASAGKQLSAAWGYLKELDTAAPEDAAALASGFTHRCTATGETGSACGKALKLSSAPPGVGFSTSIALRHIRKGHKGSAADLATNGATGSAEKKERLVSTMGSGAATHKQVRGPPLHSKHPPPHPPNPRNQRKHPSDSVHHATPPPQDEAGRPEAAAGQAPVP